MCVVEPQWHGLYILLIWREFTFHSRLSVNNPHSSTASGRWMESLMGNLMRVWNACRQIDILSFFAKSAHYKLRQKHSSLDEVMAQVGCLWEGQSEVLEPASSCLDSLPKPYLPEAIKSWHNPWSEEVGAFHPAGINTLLPIVGIALGQTSWGSCQPPLPAPWGPSLKFIKLFQSPWVTG